MSLLARIRRTFSLAARRSRAAAIRRLEQDVEWARASSDAYIAELESRLARLRADDPRSSQDVAREVCRRAKGVA